MFTIISSTDIDTLSVLTSKLAGLKAFDAPLSDNAVSAIFWCNQVNFLLEDIPQFIIQVS